MNRQAQSSDRYVYIFVRQDIPINHQIVQSNHATLHISTRCQIEDIPNVVLIGVADANALVRAAQILSENQIQHHRWFEPDYDLGFTAIATAPIRGVQRGCLAHYKLWKHNDFVHPWASGGPANSNLANVCSSQTG